MKKVIGILALVLVFSLSANAQKQRQGQRMGQKTQFTPEQMATLQTKKMQLHLDLNGTQQVEVYNLLKEKAIERKANMEEMKARKEKGEKPSDEEKFKFMEARIDKQIAHKAEMKKILNNDQFEKWEKFQALNNRNGKKGGKTAMKGKRGKRGQFKKQQS
ncbi:hypothetical protein SAMN05444411_10573 [Lutibacter oricola]|uniref:LTXXQ motif family protein n=1 Tax=Lutibacter oricola TaxID=762486 RepID=A0A1H3BC03_9FLAO|nr:hypothetical protein [Lutibacter oricola]SDX39228.1 hypothetical protein SAMN05444411_10573 [Lutibacter oricola]